MEMIFVNSPIATFDWPLNDAQTVTFVGAILRIVGNIMNGLNVITTYIIYGNKDLPTYNFGNFVNMFGLEPLIMTLSLVYFFLDIVSIPANLFYLWSVTAPMEDTEAILGDMNI